MSINELFGSENKEAAANARTLSGTAELTRISEQEATAAIRAMEADMDEYRELLQASTRDSAKLDDIIDKLVDIDGISDGEASFLKDIDEETVEGMLKSQQSKRSRCKSKTMTIDNYRSMLTAAIAEHLIRNVCNKPKSSHGGFKRAGRVDYTPADLERLEADQEQLRKEIRNIQSKKSIMKSKADFDEASEQWQALLKAERMLKDLRVGGRTEVVEVPHTKDKLAELLGDVDIEHLKAADSKELLSKIMELL